MPSQRRRRPQIGCKVLLAVRREDSGIDVGIAIGPEAGAFTEDDVDGDIFMGERPEQRSDPSISTVAMSPPAIGGAAAMPARKRGSRDQLPARERRGGRIITHAIRVTYMTAKDEGTVQRAERQQAGDRISHDPNRTEMPSAERRARN